MAVAGLSAAQPVRGWLVRGPIGAFAGAAAGGAVWFLATFALGRVPLLGGYVAVLAVLIGGGAGYGVLVGGGRRRGVMPQVTAVLITVLALVFFQWSVVWLHLSWLQDALAEHGKTMAQSVSWWQMVTEGFLGTYFLDLRIVAEMTDGVTVVPGMIFWTIALANAVAIPRRYPHGEGGRP